LSHELLSNLFPRYLQVTGIDILDDQIILHLESTRITAMCPDCGHETSKHTTYFHRKLQDLPLADKSLWLDVRVKKLRCLNPACSRKIFSETLDEFAKPKSRKTRRLDKMLVTFALLHTAEAASRLLKAKRLYVSGDTLLRLAMEWSPQINVEEIEFIGIDDFALKKNITTEQLSLILNRDK